MEKSIIIAQSNEITEHYIYKRLSEKTSNQTNKKLLKRMSDDELRHYEYWRSISKKDVKPRMFSIWFYTLIARLLGLSFGLKMMERGEKLAQTAYKKLGKRADRIILDEHRHEQELLRMLDEERLEYAGSVVLGLNDALVELTGALAGFTFALQDGRLIAIIGLITGIAAAMSMAASGYLSSREEGEGKKAIKGAIYTGSAYIVTVVLLIIPFFTFKNVFAALIATILTALLIIFTYTFYITVAKSLKFWPRFIEMAAISLTVALISFALGWVIRHFFGVEV